MARFLILICNLFIVTTIVVECFDLNCRLLKDVTWSDVGPIDVCAGENVNIISLNDKITSVNGRTEPTVLQGLSINSQTVNYLPKGIDKFFPKLQWLEVWSSKLKLLSQKDLKPFPQLMIINLHGNDLESADDDLFEFNPKLKLISFSSNKLKYVGENILSSLKDLQICFFNSNSCTNSVAQKQSEIPALIQNLKGQCKFPEYVLLLKEQWKEKIETKNNQTIIELNSTNSETISALKAENARQANLLKTCEIQNNKNEEITKASNATISEQKTKLDLQTKVIASLQDEIAKLKRWLKSCDGNLNSASAILYKTSDRQQIFNQPSSESIGLIAVVDGSKVTASDLVISSPGSIFNSVKYANGSDIDNKATTELYIDHQQTIFLPTNLVQRFFLLQVLAVTSSGLIHIDSNVFGLIKNLKILNLFNNKLQEIQTGTFDQLKLLESLDLSSNNLKNLETNALNGLEKLQNLNLAGNRLKTISFDILDASKVLKFADFTNNDCINLSYPKVTLKEIKDQLIKECIAPVEIECSMRGLDCTAVKLTIVQPKTKISGLKNQIGVNSSTFIIIEQRVAFLPFQLGKIFTDLRVLVVRRSGLTALHQRSFEGLTKLTTITIIDNNISLIEAGVFDDVPQLEQLNLSNNNIKTLPPMILAKLEKLKILNLSDNHLQSFLLEFLPSNNIIEEYLIKDNEIIKTDLAKLINLKNVKIVDFLNNICINIKYVKDKTGGKTLPALYNALRNCPL